MMKRFLIGLGNGDGVVVEGENYSVGDNGTLSVYRNLEVVATFAEGCWGYVLEYKEDKETSLEVVEGDFGGSNLH